MRQTSFEFFKNHKKTFGGAALVGRRKEKRPLSTKSPIHLILKSESQRVFLPGNQSLQKLILQTAHKFNIHVRDFALNWSHIHFVIQIQSRQDYVRFIRALTSKMAMTVANAKSGKISPGAIGIQSKQTNTKSEKLFTLRPFTRILNWGRDYKNVNQYIFLNFKESLGIKRVKQNTMEGLTSKQSSAMRASIHTS